MNYAQAKQAAIQTAHQHKQVMHVVEVNGRHFAASNMDMRRQFAGIAPNFVYSKYAAATK